MSQSLTRTAHKGWVLATVCAAVLAINLDTTIVNVALPSISRELSAGTRDVARAVTGAAMKKATMAVAMAWTDCDPMMPVSGLVLAPTRKGRPPRSADPVPA